MTDQVIPSTTQSPQSYPVPIPEVPEAPIQKFSALNYIIAFFALLVGVLFGYILSVSVQSNKVATSGGNTKVLAEELVLPEGAVKIQTCSDHKGALYILPNDIPVGPVYMVNKDKVIGIEFMLAQKEFLDGKSYKYLAGLGTKVNHINIGLLSSGHEGFTLPHYHVDLYIVDRSVEEGLMCPSLGLPSTLATPSATASQSAAITNPKSSTSSAVASTSASLRISK